MNIEKYKSDYIDQRMQLVLFERLTGRIIYSSDTIMPIQAMETIFHVSPFLESLQQTFFDFSAGDKMVFPCIHFTKQHKDNYYDLIFDIQSEHTDDMVVMQIFDFTDHYENLITVQQERNESEIKGEIQQLENEKIRLENELLEFKNEELDRIQKVKTQFFSQISHEIRNPVNAIAGLTHLLSSTKINEEGNKHIKALETVSKHLTNLINNVLDMSKIESGVLGVEVDSFNLMGVINSVHHAFQYQAIEKQIDLTCQVHHSIPDTIRGDSHKLSQILYNLVGNALKFTHEGSITLTVNLVNVLENSLLLAFKVKDTGIGISEVEQKNILKPYVQATSDTLKKYGGTGLGLPIVSQLVDLLGGELFIESSPGEGSTFRFIMPFLFDEEVVDVPKISGTSEIKESKKPDKVNILVLEDDPLNSMIINEILKQDYKNILLVSKVDEAIEELKKISIDLVITDWNLNNEHPAKLLDYMQDHMEDVPVIFVTGDKNHKVEKWDRLKSDILFKPIEANQIKSRVSKSLGFGEAPTYDLEKLRKICNNDKKKISEIVNVFCTKTPDDIKQIFDDLSRNDYKKIRSSIHKIKNSFSYLGVMDIYSDLDNIEKEIDQIPRDELKSKLKGIEVFTNQIIARLKSDDIR